MTDRNGYLVVGGDSLVGGGLFKALQRRGHAALASTRRPDSLDVHRIYLDFETDAQFRVPAGIDYAFVVAAATNYERCERDPLAHHINVELIPRFVVSLLEQGIFVTFISTNSVFGGERPWPGEDDPHAPGIAYARQKDSAEEVIRRACRGTQHEEHLNIVRLTKIMGHDTSPLPNWFSAWAKEEPVQPFSDLIFAPMSVRFVGDALAIIGEKRVAGNLHLSGAENVSYVDFARCLASKLAVDSRLIVPSTAEEKGIVIPFKPRYSGLGMKRTTELTGITPQTLEEVVSDLTKQSVN